MAALDPALERLKNQRLIGEPLDTPEDAVRHLVAVQAQEYALAKWSLGQRTHEATDTDAERALTEGSILRTHILRQTWHFVLPEDIRWLLALTAPRVHMQNGTYYRRFGLDPKQLSKCHRVIAAALEGGRHRTRNELAEALEREGIPAEGQHLAYIVMHAELEALVCSGPRRGNQFTYALLDERVPPTRPRSPDEALAEIVLRFFSSRGPATEKDLRWWSSLKIADIRRGLEMVQDRLARISIDGVDYWIADMEPPKQTPSPTVHLLQGYDEIFSSYSDSRHFIDLANLGSTIPETHNFYVHGLLIDGQLAGAWRRTLKGRIATVELRLGRDLSKAERRAVQEEIERFGAFNKVEAVVRHV